MEFENNFLEKPINCMPGVLFGSEGFTRGLALSSLDIYRPIVRHNGEITSPSPLLSFMGQPNVARSHAGLSWRFFDNSIFAILCPGHRTHSRHQTIHTSYGYGQDERYMPSWKESALAFRRRLTGMKYFFSNSAAPSLMRPVYDTG